jgi:hypothetical protein
MSWHGALSKQQSQDFFRSYIKSATDFETNSSLSGIQKSKRIPIEQLLKCLQRDGCLCYKP